jgi:hypothetical protein
VLFADVAGSTALADRLDPESLQHVMSRYFAEAKAAIERHGGMVEKFIGDAVMGVFGVPALHEDDAMRAVRAAIEMRAALQELNGRSSASGDFASKRRPGSTAARCSSPIRRCPSRRSLASPSTWRRGSSRRLRRGRSCSANRRMASSRRLSRPSRSMSSRSRERRLPFAPGSCSASRPRSPGCRRLRSLAASASCRCCAGSSSRWSRNGAADSARCSVPPGSGKRGFARVLRLTSVGWRVCTVDASTARGAAEQSSACRPSAKERQPRTPTRAARTTACRGRRYAQPVASNRGAEAAHGVAGSLERVHTRTKRHSSKSLEAAYWVNEL